MSKFKDDILKAAGGEPIDAIVIGDYGWGSPDRRLAAAGKILTWTEAAPLLDYEYDDGFGGPECHAFVAWTTNRVLYVHEYDGSTSVSCRPRNPTTHMPDMC